MKAGFNWAGAFTAYVGGSTPEEVATVFGIPEETLQVRMSTEKWAPLKEKLLAQSRALVLQHPDQAPMLKADAQDLLPPEIRARLTLIKNNRETQYRRAVRMGEELDKILNGLADGSYKVGKWLSIPKVGPQWVEAAPGPADLVNIATYARTLADLAYRALGDAAADGQERRTEVQAANNPQQAITIILPGSIAQPRGERQLPDAIAGASSAQASQKVIDLRPAPSQDQPPSDLPGAPGAPS